MKTMGQMVDEALAMHAKRYPASEVYRTEVFESGLKDGTWLVDVWAEHFSHTLQYVVKRDAKPDETLLGSVEHALTMLLDAYNYTPGPMALEDHNEVLWILIRTMCKARGKRVPRELPKQWPPTEV